VPDPTFPDWPARRLAVAFGSLVALTTGLVVLGALVRAHNAGLACPDWPRCFGAWIPQMDLRVAFEWTHRLLAGSIALLFAAAAFTVARRPGARRAAGRPVLLAGLLLVTQVVLGGLTVLLGLAPWTVTAHLLTGTSFDAALLWTALALREEAEPRPRPTLPTGVRRAVWGVAALALLQVALGGLVSSYYASLACPDWPACSGGTWFPTWRGGVGLHLLHRMNGYALVFALGAAARAARRHAGLALPLRLGFGLALVQATVGIANVRLGIPVELTALHSALAVSLILTVTWGLREAVLRPVGSDGPRRRVVVVGAGFGGLAVARALRDTPVEVLVVDRENYHAFLPLLYQVATAGLSAQDVTHPVRTILRRCPNARFRMAEIHAVDLGARELETREGQRIPYDVLVVAAGSTTEYFGKRSAAEHAFPLHHVEDAVVLRNHVLTCLERAADAEDPAEREALLGFVVVGGGPTGVELCGMLGEMRRHVLPRDFPGLAPRMRVILLEGRDRLLGAFPERLCRRALEQVRELGVEVRLDAFVEEVEAGGVRLRGGERLAAQTVVWTAGVRGSPLGRALGGTGRGGRVPVDETLRLEGHPEVFAIGDLAAVRGAEDLPQVAQVAIQQGRCIARNLRRWLAGAPPLPFSYWHAPTMATIGRHRAVAWIFGAGLSGRAAWLLWLVAHLVFLAGFRNRAVVFVNWIYNYFTYDLGVRAIVGSRRPGARAPGTSDQVDAA
jgi:NADH:quinone reductase (non-electrogenic)